MFGYEPFGSFSLGSGVEPEYSDWQVFNNQLLSSDEFDQFRAIVNYAVPLL